MFIWPFYISDLTITGDVQEICGGKIAESFAIIENDFFKLYIDAPSCRQTSESVFNRIMADKKYFKRVVKNIYRYSKDLERFSRKIKKISVTKLADDKLVSLLAVYIKKLRIIRAWGWVPVFLDALEKSYLTEYIQEELQKILRAKNLSNKMGEYYSVLTSSEKKSEVQREELARLNLLLEVLKHKKSDEIAAAIKNNQALIIKQESPAVYGLLEKHLRKFGWLTYAYDGPVMQMNYLLKTLGDNLLKSDISDQKKILLEYYKNIKKEKKKLIKNLDLPKSSIYPMNVSAELMYIKDYRKGVYQKSYVAMDKVLEELAKRLQMSLYEIKYMVFDEIKDALLGGTADKYRDLLKIRTKKCCYLAVDGRITVWEGEECEKKISEKIGREKTLEAMPADQKEIKGLVAFGGKARGKVKIVLVEKDVAKVQEGDILVSSATNPDLIIAMKKCSAIVTDTGGIVSHAAIISRELKKPCVVGTRIATHLLKDGDLVEVDADRGVVVKLN